MTVLTSIVLHFSRAHSLLTISPSRTTTDRPIDHYAAGERSRFKGQEFWEEKNMLYWAVVCLIIAIVAGVLGFGGVAGAATNMARILFVIFLVLFLVGLVMQRPV
jgi:uncharacterized membrane protein YtjA (UPF0391 family)